MNKQTFSAAELAERFGLSVHGDAGTMVSGVGTLAAAQAQQLAFLANSKYRNQLPECKAGIVVLRADDAELAPGTALVARDPYSAFAKISALFEPVPLREPGIHPSAVIDPSASIGEGVHIGPFVSIGARSSIGAGAIIGPNCSIGEDCTVGEACELQARVSLVARVRLGKRVRILPGAVLGAAGFGLAMDFTDNGSGHWINVPQLGGVVVGDDCEIGANSCIDRGALDDTVLDEDVRIDNLVQIGHNVRIGAHTAMAGCSAAAGSARIGRYCLIGGGAGVLGHLEVCDKVTITAMSLVTHSIREPGEYSSGTPLTDNLSWRKNAARFKQLDALARRVGTARKETE